jgi:hypothetical protein
VGEFDEGYLGVGTKVKGHGGYDPGGGATDYIAYGDAGHEDTEKCGGKDLDDSGYLGVGGMDGIDVAEEPNDNPAANDVERSGLPGNYNSQAAQHRANRVGRDTANQESFLGWANG